MTWFHQATMFAIELYILVNLIVVLSHLTWLKLPSEARDYLTRAFEAREKPKDAQASDSPDVRYPKAAPPREPLTRLRG